jgi:hypothetical protein
MEFSIGNSERDTISVNVTGYERSPVGEWYDDNWLRTEIRVKAGSFSGTIYGAMLTLDFLRFATQLRLVFETLSGSAEFATLEEQLSLRLVCDKMGRIELKGEIADQPGIGNRLTFSNTLDQSYLRKTLDQLDAIVARYPERKQPNQSTDPASASSTSRAGHGPRHR